MFYNSGDPHNDYQQYYHQQAYEDDQSNYHQHQHYQERNFRESRDNRHYQYQENNCQYYENKENKNDPQSLNYYLGRPERPEREYDRTWYGGEDGRSRRSRSPRPYYKGNRRYIDHRNSQSRVHSRSPNSPRSYRERSARRRSSKSPRHKSRSSSRSRFSRRSQRSRERDKRKRTRSSHSDSSDSSYPSPFTTVSPEGTRRRVKYRSPVDKNDTRPESVVTKVDKSYKDEGFSDANEITKKSVHLKHAKLKRNGKLRVEPTAVELSMSPISSEDFSQRSEEAESDGEVGEINITFLSDRKSEDENKMKDEGGQNECNSENLKQKHDINQNERLRMRNANTDYDKNSKLCVENVENNDSKGPDSHQTPLEKSDFKYNEKLKEKSRDTKSIDTNHNTEKRYVKTFDRSKIEETQNKDSEQSNDQSLQKEDENQNCTDTLPKEQIKRIGDSYVKSKETREKISIEADHIQEESKKRVNNLDNGEKEMTNTINSVNDLQAETKENDSELVDNPKKNTNDAVANSSSNLPKDYKTTNCKGSIETLENTLYKNIDLVNKDMISKIMLIAKEVHNDIDKEVPEDKRNENKLINEKSMNTIKQHADQSGDDNAKKWEDKERNENSMTETSNRTVERRKSQDSSVLIKKPKTDSTTHEINKHIQKKDKSMDCKDHSGIKKTIDTAKKNISSQKLDRKHSKKHMDSSTPRKQVVQNKPKSDDIHIKVGKDIKVKDNAIQSNHSKTLIGKPDKERICETTSSAPENNTLENTLELDQSRSHTLSLKDKKKRFEELIKSKDRKKGKDKHGNKSKDQQFEDNINEIQKVVKDKTENMILSDSDNVEKKKPSSDTLKVMSKEVKERRHSGAEGTLKISRERKQSGAVEEEANRRERKHSGAIELKNHTKERRLSGTMEPVPASSSPQQGSESSPTIIKGRMHSGDLFIPLGRPAEKKLKISPATKPSQHENSWIKQSENKEATGVLNERRNSVSELKDKFDITAEKNTADKSELKKNLFGKNKKRISHYKRDKSNSIDNDQQASTVTLVKHPSSQKGTSQPYENKVQHKKDFKNDTKNSDDGADKSSLKSKNDQVHLKDLKVRLSPVDNIFEKIKQSGKNAHETNTDKNVKVGMKRQLSENANDKFIAEKKKKYEESDKIVEGHRDIDIETQVSKGQIDNKHETVETKQIDSNSERSSANSDITRDNVKENKQKHSKESNSNKHLGYLSTAAKVRESLERKPYKHSRVSVNRMEKVKQDQPDAQIPLKKVDNLFEGKPKQKTSIEADSKKKTNKLQLKKTKSIDQLDSYNENKNTESKIEEHSKEKNSLNLINRRKSLETSNLETTPTKSNIFSEISVFGPDQTSVTLPEKIQSQQNRNDNVSDDAEKRCCINETQLAKEKTTQCEEICNNEVIEMPYNSKSLHEITPEDERVETEIRTRCDERKPFHYSDETNNNQVDSDNESDVGDIEPIEMIGTDFINDVCNDSIFDSYSGLENVKTDDTIIKFCDDVVNVPKVKDICKESEGLAEIVHGNESRQPSAKSKNTPRKRFGSKLASLARQIEDDDDRSIEIVKEPDSVATIQYTTEKSKPFLTADPKVVSRDHVDDVDEELLGVELTPPKETSPPTTSSQWLEKARSKLKIPPNIIKSRNTSLSPAKYPESAVSNGNLNLSGTIPEARPTCENPKENVLDNDTSAGTNQCSVNQNLPSGIQDLHFSDTAGDQTNNQLDETTEQIPNMVSCTQVQLMDGNGSVEEDYEEEMDLGDVSSHVVVTDKNTENQLPLNRDLPMQKQHSKEHVPDNIQSDSKFANSGAVNNIVYSTETNKRDLLTSKNVGTIPMLNPLTMRLMDKSMYQNNSDLNKNDFTGIPFATPSPHGMPVVVSEVNQTPQTLSCQAATAPLKTNNVSVVGQNEIPEVQEPTPISSLGPNQVLGVHEPIPPTTPLQQEQAVAEQEVSRRISNENETFNNAVAKEEERRKLLHQLLELYNIKTGDPGLDLILFGRICVHRGLTTIDQEVLRMYRERLADNQPPSCSSSNGQ